MFQYFWCCCQVFKHFNKSRAFKNHDQRFNVCMIVTQNYYWNYSNSKLLGYSAVFCDEWQRNKKSLVPLTAPSFINCAFVQFCSHLKMRLSETKDELAQCFASVSILSNHDFSARVDVDSWRRGFGVVRAASDVKPYVAVNFGVIV